MLMGDWQELSGFVRSQSSEQRNKQNEFWRALKAHLDKEGGNPLQLDENERLCAMALIKRLFPHVAKDVFGWAPSWDGQKPLRWPSIPRLAATGWLRCAWEKAPEEAKALVRLLPSDRSIEPELDPGNRLSQVPGALLHRSGIENARPDELAGNEGDAEATRAKLLGAHKALSNEAGEPSVFYAVLLMDGDRVGAMLRSQEANIAKGLAGFSARVDATIRQHGGNTIYAGGDDVLALLPLEGAVPAVLELRQRYRNAFAITPKPTISAALVFAHFHVPLRHVLRVAHRQLDEVAKDGNGRDSLAVCVLTQSGVTREWVSMWETDTATPVQTMIDAARDIDEKTSGRFFYAIREQYEEVIAGNVLGDDDIKSLLIAEYSRSEAGAGRARDDVGRHVDRLFMLAERHAARDSARIKEAPSVSMDGPLIARFLARETRYT
jgi:CRISPR-associated protein Cmr2